MIDYDKLKYAHELARKLPYKDYVFNCWCCKTMGMKWLYVLNYYDGSFIAHEYEYESLDDLITKLEELSKPEYKYRVGDEYWVLINNEPKYGCILSVAGDNAMISIEANSYDVDEFDLYPAREALIESQISHWTNLLAEDMHKSPGASCCSVHAGSDEECAREDDTHKKASMNNFTKDELEFLKICIRQAQAYNRPEVTECAYIDGYANLIKKAQAMIEGYCEHEELFKGNDGWSKCKKCGEFYR